MQHKNTKSRSDGGVAFRIPGNANLFDCPSAQDDLSWSFQLLLVLETGFKLCQAQSLRLCCFDIAQAASELVAIKDR